MKLLMVVCALAQLTWAKPGNFSTASLIDAINSKKSSWQAGVNFPQENSNDFIKRRLGFLGIHQDPNYQPKVITHKIGRETFPESFDARDRWPECRDVIDNIRDQGQCGSCWAFSSAEVMSDRLCIQTKGELKFEFSPQDLLSCCSYCGYGCDGGYTAQAWNFWENSGIVSGGDYNTNKECQPYEERAYLNGSTPSCKKSCTNNNYQVPYSNDKRYGETHNQLPAKDVKQIMTEIMTNGPVQASYSVYEDFGLYKNGVYQYVRGELLGGHAIKIIGWGVENNVTYWLVANSWGPEWGLKGYFKIRRGTNECGIEDRVFMGVASLQTDRDNDEGQPGSAVKVLSSGLALLLGGLIFFIAFD